MMVKCVTYFFCPEYLHIGDDVRPTDELTGK